MGLGVPYNIASYSLLTYLIANIINAIPGRFTHFLGNYHVYNAHIEQLKEQMSRFPYPFPKLVIKRKPAYIEDYTYQDISLEHYCP